MGVPARVRGQEYLDRRQCYVYTPNHFSLLDIALVGYIPQPFVFISKLSLTRLPLFGWVIRTFHIPVDRGSTRSSYQALQQSLRKIDEGKSMVMYPEGGIRTSAPPRLAHFKSGPFRVAIEKQVPVVPVTIPYNWFILAQRQKAAHAAPPSVAHLPRTHLHCRAYRGRHPEVTRSGVCGD